MSPETARKIFFTIAIAIVGLIIVYSLISLIAFFGRKKVDIFVDSLPKGATFELGGKTYATPAKVEGVKEGSFSLKLEKEGYIVRVSEVAVSEDTDNEFLFRLYTDNTSPNLILEELERVSGEASKINNLINKLPYNVSKFVIKFGNVEGELRFMVTLYPETNPTKNEKKYKTELAELKKEAIQWLEKQGVDINKLNIFWYPREAKNL